MGQHGIGSLPALKTQLIPIWCDGMLYPEISMYEKIIENTFTATYSPYDKFPKVASMLRAMVGHLSENSPDLVQNAVLGFPSDQGMRTASVKTVP